MKEFKVLILPGDGIGPEIMDVALTFLEFFEEKGFVKFKYEHAPIGGTCYDLHGVSVQEETVKIAADSDAIFFGAVGGEKWANVPYEQRPEAGLLRLRKEFSLFANLRPAYCYDSLVSSSPLKEEYVKGVDLIILRELTAGVYFGEPKQIIKLENGEEKGMDGQVYTTSEIARVARKAFELAGVRRKKVTSVEKHNVMKTGVLWKKVVTEVHKDFPEIELQHMLADNCAMQLIRNPKQFDVVVTDNLFGDILSDESAMLTGSLGMLPSASLGLGKHALYEPVHGSAPDIAGEDKANPIAMINSIRMAFIYSFNMPDLAKKIDDAINMTLAENIRTQDIAETHSKIVGTVEMGNAILKNLEKLL